MTETTNPGAGTGPPQPAAVEGRAGTPPADSPALAVERAKRITEVSAQADEPEALTTDQIMPTCMIYAMFIGLALLLGTMAFWMVGAFGALHLIH